MRQLTLFDDLLLPLKCNPDEARECLRRLKAEAHGLIIGTDEAGRGALAGPVSAAAVYLTEAQEERLLAMKLRDSKMISPKRREDIFNVMNSIGVRWRVAWGTPSMIDEKNILRASLLTMAKCVNELAGTLNDAPACLIADGNKPIPDIKIRQWTLIRADKMIPVVSAASIVAKVLRDRLMTNLAKRYPGYDFERNKGYPTAAHIGAVRDRGMSDIHRRSFCRKILER
ncbi:MAG: ribonuclease HII [Synergistaceae bacterium]|nr:ribonuclease HII [Synergistaceae bacterium]